MDEKNRKLTEAEKRRLAHFEQVKETLIQDGYTVKELTIGIVKANVYAILMVLPLCLFTVIPFILVNRGKLYFEGNPLITSVLFVITLVVLVVVHELIHGLTWSIFAEDHFKSIEFGFMKEYATPYCTCTVPLKKGAYIAGALMPLIILGIMPAVIAIFTGSFFLLAIGFVMIMAAGGDIMIVLKLLGYKSGAADVLIYDHPTQAGSVIFER